jgi:hypothetical protein
VQGRGPIGCGWPLRRRGRRRQQRRHRIQVAKALIERGADGRRRGGGSLHDERCGHHARSRWVCGGRRHGERDREGNRRRWRRYLSKNELPRTLRRHAGIGSRHRFCPGRCKQLAFLPLPFLHIGWGAQARRGDESLRASVDSLESSVVAKSRRRVKSAQGPGNVTPSGPFVQLGLPAGSVRSRIEFTNLHVRHARFWPCDAHRSSSNGGNPHAKEN